MPIRRLKTQPEILKGHEYGPGIYEWFELFTDTGGPYAVFGVCFDHPTEAWLYWRILDRSLIGWRDLYQVSVPEMRRYVAARGRKFMVVSTSDPQDVDYKKMVGFMGFTNHKIVQTSWQEV